MESKILKIDTNDVNARLFEQNQELFDLIVPNILFLVEEDGKLLFSEDIDWVKTRPYFEATNNGHCIILKSGGYIAAYEFVAMGVKLEKTDFIDTLSELCDYLAEKHDIKSWVNKSK
jgi:hypothetical protein